MKVAAFYGKSDLRIEERPIPVAGPGQMVVKIDVVGICGTDVETIVPGQIASAEPNLQFSFTYTQEDVQIYLDLLAAGKLSFPNMVTGVNSLDECIEKVFESDRKGQIKELIDPGL